MGDNPDLPVELIAAADKVDAGAHRKWSDIEEMYVPFGRLSLVFVTDDGAAASPQPPESIGLTRTSSAP